MHIIGRAEALRQSHNGKRLLRLGHEFKELRAEAADVAVQGLAPEKGPAETQSRPLQLGDEQSPKNGLVAVVLSWLRKATGRAQPQRAASLPESLRLL